MLKKIILVGCLFNFSLIFSSDGYDKSGRLIYPGSPQARIVLASHKISGLRYLMSRTIDPDLIASLTDGVETLKQIQDLEALREQYALRREQSKTKEDFNTSSTVVTGTEWALAELYKRMQET